MLNIQIDIVDMCLYEGNILFKPFVFMVKQKSYEIEKSFIPAPIFLILSASIANYFCIFRIKLAERRG